MEATWTIERAGIDDAAAIAEVHVAGWRWAYERLVPRAALHALSVEERTSMWRSILSLPENESAVWIARRQGNVIGFVATGPDAAEETAAVTHAIYLEPAVVGTGVGRALFGHAIEDLRARGFASALLWVLESNARARRFYEKAGWLLDGTSRPEPMGGCELQSVRYRMTLRKVR